MDRVVKKFDKSSLNQEVAEQMLSNVFAACEYEGNRVPLEVLLSYSNYRRERYLLQKVVIVLVLIAFLLMPVLFVTADIDASWVENTPPGSPIVEMMIKSFLPLESITASIDGYPLEVYQSEEGIYQVRPDRNGTLLLMVTLVNKQYTHEYIVVDSVDVTPPALLSSKVKDGNLEIFLEDDSGMLNFDGIYAVDPNGSTVKPVGHDEAKMSVSFAFPESNLNIFVPDQCKNTLQLILTVQNTVRENP